MPNLNRKVDESARWPRCPDCPHRHAPGSPCPPTRTFRHPDAPAPDPDLIWMIRPMPRDQWPPDPALPRDNTFHWWVRSHCGHEGGARQWAFYDQRYARMYEPVFRADPCRYTHCHDQKRKGDA